MTAVQDEGGEESKWRRDIQYSDTLHHDTKFSVTHIFDFNTECSYSLY